MSSGRRVLKTAQVKKKTGPSEKSARTDYSNQSLEHKDFTGSDLAGADFSGAVLTKANFTEANLEGADFAEAELEDAVLTKANLERANLREAYLMRADLNGANLKKACLSDAFLMETKFNKANLENADLSNTNFWGAELSGAIMRRANISGADLSGTIIDQAFLMNTVLTNTNLYGADLTGTDLRESKLTKTNLSNSTLVDTVLKEADITDAKMERADLTNADLTEADLAGTTLTHSNLTGANLENSILSRNNLFDANLTNCRLYGAILSDLQINEGTIFRSTEKPVKDVPWWKVSIFNEPPRCIYDPDVLDGLDELEKAVDIYRLYEQLARDNSLSNLESEMFVLRKDMQRKLYLKHKNIFGYFFSLVSRIIFKYGESIGRLLFWGAAVILTSTTLAANFELLVKSGEFVSNQPVAQRWMDSFFFSTIIFATLGEIGFTPVTTGGQLLIMHVAILGSIWLALLIFVLGRWATK